MLGVKGLPPCSGPLLRLRAAGANEQEGTDGDGSQHNAATAKRDSAGSFAHGQEHPNGIENRVDNRQHHGLQGGQTLGGFGEKSVTHRDYDTGDHKNSDVTGGGKLRLKGPGQ